MENNLYSQNILSICEYVLAFICNRQRELSGKDSLKNRLALLEEYKEWISEGISHEYILYLISKNEIS